MPKSSETPVLQEKSADLLPLVNRYHAAWLEHGTRVTQRQNCIQIYLASAGLVFGFYVAAPVEKQSSVALPLMVGISFLTIAAAMLIHMHIRVMQRLCDFMMRARAEKVSGTVRLLAFNGS